MSREVCFCLLLVACGESAPSAVDAGAPVLDSSLPDAAVGDAGSDDAGADAAVHPFASVDAIVERRLDELMGGLALSVLRADETVYRRGYGSFEGDLDRVVVIASATKWISAAVVMSQVEAGTLSLDSTLAGIPSMAAREDLARITVRQAFSHTAGMPGVVNGLYPGLGRIDYLRDPRITLEESVDFIATRDLTVPPGTLFSYGGGSMQSVGRLVELAASEPYQEVFRRTIGEPLGMTETRYDAYGGPTENPHIGGGITSRLSDLEAFVDMLLNWGERDGARVLTRESLEAMEADQTMGVPIGFTAVNFDDIDSTLGSSRYGIGVWRMRTDLDPEVQYVSQGATGVAFLVNRDLEYGLVFVVDGESGAYRTMMPAFRELIHEVRLIMETLD